MGGDTRIYVGNLPLDIRERDVERLFEKYGRITRIDLKIPNRRPAYCFIEFDDPRDASDAVRGRDRYRFEGEYLRVEFSRGSRERRGPSKRSDYRIIISNLPASGSWQDLKDHFRKAGDIVFADVNRDGTGVVEFAHRDDMQYAIDHMDDSEFRSHGGETAHIRVSADRSSRDRSASPRRRSRSPSRSRSRSRSRSPRRRSPSPERRRDSREPSPARSRSR